MSRKKGAEHTQICSLQQSHRDALVQYETAWRSQLDDYKQMYKSRVKLTVKTDDIIIVGDQDAVIAVSNDVQEFLKSHAMQEQFLDMALDMAKMILQTKQDEINAIKDDVDDDVADPVIETSSRGIRILATEDTCEAVKVKLEEIKCEVLGVNEPLETTSRGITGDMRKQMISGHCNDEVKQKLKETKSNYEVMKDKEVPRAMGIYMSVFDPKQFSQLQTNVVSGCSNDASSNELTTDKMAANMVSVYFKVNVGDTGAASSFAGKFGHGFINNLENQSKTVIENRTAPDNKPVASSGFLHDNMKMQIEDEDKDYTLYFCCGDLTDFPCDAIVNSTTPNLEFNGKLSRDIKGKGGSDVATCCNTYVAANGTLSTSEVYAGCCPGELDCKTILHVSSPQWQHGGREKEKQLYDAVTNILTKAEEMRFYSVALPAISSGGFGFPLDVCLKNIFSAIRDYFEERIASGGKGLLREVHLVDINDKVFDTIKQCMNQCFDSRKIFDTNTRHSRKPAAECSACADEGSSGFTRIDYAASTEHIENPSRGFMELWESVSSDSTPRRLSPSFLNGLREEDGITVIWALYILDSYVTSDITGSFLQGIRDDLQACRDAKFTMLVRFHYTKTSVSEAPYGDATKSRMKSHIAQVRDIMFEYEDVIDAVQAGWIGIWGEWYYTTDFGDPNDNDWSNPDNVRGMTPQNWADRGEITRDMLDNIPVSIPIQVRVPQYKYHIIGDTTPATEADMVQQNDKARTGHYNDCFLASSTDFGTYINKAVEYPYMSADNNYAFMAGETCALEENDRHRCPTALEELQGLHFSLLNQNYNRDVLQTWIDDGCYTPIHRNLGYRFVLDRAVLPEQVSMDGVLCFRIELDNVGYAAPYKQRTVALVLRDKSDGNLYSADIPDVDPRTWLSGQHVIIDTAVNVPQDIQPGQYETLLVIKDPNRADISDYNILLANRAVPEYTKGFNNLLHDIQVVGAPSEPGTTCPTVTPLTAPVESVYSRRYCGLESCEEFTCLRLDIANPSFEETGGWDHYGNSGFTYTNEHASDGAMSIRISDGGATQTWTFPTGTRTFTVTADSRNENIVGGDSNNYSIYCDVKYADDTWDYGQAAQFEVGNSNWHTKVLTVKSPSKDISEGWCYAMFRDYSAGTAWFDNFHVFTSTDPNGCN